MPRTNSKGNEYTTQPKRLVVLSTIKLATMLTTQTQVATAAGIATTTQNSIAQADNSGQPTLDQGVSSSGPFQGHSITQSCFTIEAIVTIVLLQN